MSFIELTRIDGEKILINKYHVSSVSKSLGREKCLVVRLNSGQMQEITDDYNSVKVLLEGKNNECK